MLVRRRRVRLAGGLGLPTQIEHFDRCWREADDEHDERHERQAPSGAIERNILVNRARMTGAERNQHTDRQHRPHDPGT